MDQPQLTRLGDEAPVGDGWLHEIKYDGYRMHARIDGGKVALLTRIVARMQPAGRTE
jgi:bifunctional non-homologous end joining protein LigD